MNLDKILLIYMLHNNSPSNFQLLSRCLWLMMCIHLRFWIVYVFPSIHVKYRGLDPRKCGDVIAQSASVHLSVTGTEMHLYSYICVSVYLYLNLCICICVFILVYLCPVSTISASVSHRQAWIAAPLPLPWVSRLFPCWPTTHRSDNLRSENYLLKSLSHFPSYISNKSTLLLWYIAMYLKM